MLILDEPTNHLDLDAREALEDALRAFDGAVLLVSHDRALLDAVGSRTFAFEDGRLRAYEGGWAEYARVREERREAEAASAAAAKQERRAGSARSERRTRSGPSKNAQRRVVDLGHEVERAEAALAAVEDELSDPAMWSSPSRSERSTARHDAARRAVAEAYARWEQATANGHPS